MTLGFPGAAGCTVAQIHPSASHIIIVKINIIIIGKNNNINSNNIVSIMINKNNNNNNNINNIMIMNLAPCVEGCTVEQIDISLRILPHHDPDHHVLDHHDLDHHDPDYHDLDDQLVCRCGGMFCGIHRYSDKHDCTFDYGALGKSEIAAANPVIVAEKVAKI